MVVWVLSVLLSTATAGETMPNPVVLRVMGAETGDRGCYLSGVETLPDGRDVARNLMADFGCEESFILGKAYEIRWSAERVQAATCEGNPDCPDFDLEAFAHAAKPAVPRPNVVFEPGRRSATLAGLVEPGEHADVLIFAARAGQQVAVAMVSADDNAAFTLSASTEGGWSALGSGTTWSGVLPRTEGGVYQLTVSADGGAASYELFVGLGRELGAAGAAPAGIGSEPSGTAR